VCDINKIEMLFIDMTEYSDQAKTNERTNERNGYDDYYYYYDDDEYECCIAWSRVEA
jgi:hypothetical protein